MASLLLGEAPLITLSPDGTGADLVLASMRSDAIAQNMTGGRYCYWVRMSPDDRSVQGLIALRDGTHLYQLFVRSGLHRQGIGKMLWQRMLMDWPNPWPRPKQISVNASPYGLPAYESFGFEPTGPRTEINGIAFVPMSFSLHHP